MRERTITLPAAVTDVASPIQRITVSYQIPRLITFLPERSTDFVFAVMGEEFGLLGLLLLLALYLAVIGRGLFIAMQAQETFTRLLAGTLSLTFFFYVFVNAGMVCGLLPIVGVPLPFISAGGTSMVTLMAGFGMLVAIKGNKKLLAP